MIDGRKLSNTVGAVLDPIFALRRRVRIAPGAVARISFWTMAASTRETLLDIIDKHRDVTAYARATTLAWTQAQVQLHHLSVTAGEASPVPASGKPCDLRQPDPAPAVRHDPSRRRGAVRAVDRSAFPAICRSCCCASPTPTISMSRANCCEAHEYWRMKQLAVDLVILNERQSSYVQDLQIALETLLRTRQMRPRLRGEDSPGGVFVLRGDLISAETSALLTSVARVVIVAQRGGLFAQLDRIVEAPTPARPPASPARRSACRIDPPPVDGGGRKAGIFQRARRLRQATARNM